MTHAEQQPGRTDCPGNLTARYQLSRRSGQFTVYTCQQCGWTNDPRRRRQQTDGAKPVRIGATMKTMRLSLNRKAGAPNYGSDGVGIELEIEIPEDQGMSGIPEIALTYYAMLQHTVDLQLERMSASHAEPGPATAAAGPPRRRQPEPSAADYDPEPEHRSPPPEPQRNGGSRNGSSHPRNGPPRTAMELLGWAKRTEMSKQLFRLSDEAGRGQVRDWDEDMVQWAYTELTRRAERPAGRWGSGRN